MGKPSGKLGVKRLGRQQANSETIKRNRLVDETSQEMSRPLSWQVVLVDVDAHGVPGEQLEQLFVCPGPEGMRHAIMRAAGYNQPVRGYEGPITRIAVAMPAEMSADMSSGVSR